MEFYNDPVKVDEYEKMCDEYDGSELYKVLDNHLKNDAAVLELGCGPENDIAHLQKKYNVTGSDLSNDNFFYYRPAINLYQFQILLFSLHRV